MHSQNHGGRAEKAQRIQMCISFPNIHEKACRIAGGHTLRILQVLRAIQRTSNHVQSNENVNKPLIMIGKQMQSFRLLAGLALIIEDREVVHVCVKTNAAAVAASTHLSRKL